MLYSTRVQQRVCTQAHHGVPLRTTERTLTWPYAGARVQVPVSGGQGVAGSNPAVPTVQTGFSAKVSGANWGANGFPEQGQASAVAFAFRMRFTAVALSVRAGRISCR
jgi:hypothetical protein